MQKGCGFMKFGLEFGSKSGTEKGDRDTTGQRKRGRELTTCKSMRKLVP